MGAPKQKWTSGEEAALRAGVVKYGPGKWRAIQKDPTLGPSLATRSNVDLKDKWRNMNVSSGGHGSGEKSVKSFSKKTTKESISAIPLASFPGEYSAEKTRGIADSLDNLRSLGPRYDNLVLEAILSLRESNGSSISTIANFIEEHQRVPSNFRMLLNLTLRDLSLQGKVLKSRQKYVVIDTENPMSKSEVPLEQEGDDVKISPRVHKDARKKMRGVMKVNDSKISDTEVLQDSDGGKLTRMSLRNALRKPKGDHILKKARMDVDFARSKLKTAEEAARVAALAVAEAEVAAAAAEQTAKDAEAAEAVAEAAEISAAIAALTARPRKKMRAVALAVEKVAVV